MKVLVHMAQKPSWPYTKAPETRTVELKPGERTNDADSWVILGVEYQADEPTAEQRQAELDPEGRWLAWPPTRRLVIGHEYRVRTRDGSQQHPREHRMSFLGHNAALGSDTNLIFNARPAFGTQEFRPDSIIATMDLGRSEGREDSRRYMNKVIK